VEAALALHALAMHALASSCLTTRMSFRRILILVAQFTCFTGTKVRILTQLEPQQRQRKWKQLLACKPDDKYEHPQDVAGMEDAKKHMVLNFLALLVQKYRY